MSNSCSPTKTDHDWTGSNEKPIWAAERSAWREMANWAAIRAGRRGRRYAAWTFRQPQPRAAGEHHLSPHCPAPSRSARPTQNVAPERFHEQLTGLLRRGFNFWPLTRFSNAATKGCRFRRRPWS